MKNLIKWFRTNEELHKFFKVVFYISLSGLITLTLRYAEVLKLDEQTILLANGLFNLVIYKGKDLLDNFLKPSK